MFITSAIKNAIDSNQRERSIKHLDLSSLTRDAYSLKKREGNAIFTDEEILHIPATIAGNANNLEAGNLPVFADDDVLFTGLKNFVFGYTKSNLPIFVCDNHNFVVDAWQLVKGAQLVHIDQHRDEALCHGNEVHSSELLVSNYIHFATLNKIIQPNFISFTESSDLIKLPLLEHLQGHIVNLDIDIFDPECTILSLEEKMQIIINSCKNAALLTIATSPGFINQNRAIAIAKTIWENI